MNNLKKLIQEKCPNGVQYKAIKDICKLHYGKGNTIPKNGGKYPVYGCNGIVGTTNEYNNENSPIIGHIGSAGVVTWGEGKHFVTYNGTICTPNENVLSRYIYHLLLNLHLEKYVKGSQPFLSASDFQDIKVPVPPLEIQSEIICILDNFIELTTELTTELTLRKQQYEYYKKVLFSFKNSNNIQYIKVADIAVRNKGTSITAKKMKELDKQGAPVKIFAAGNTIANVNFEDIPEEDIIYKPSIIVKSRGYIGFEYYNHPFSNKAELWSYTVNDEKFNQKFVYYYLMTLQDKLQRIARNQSVKLPQIYHNNTDTILIPIISIEEQERIVSILDKFDKLTNDILEGIPAEIEARKIQYEFYRNKLLDFKKLKED